MKKLLIATILTLILSIPAFAADVTVESKRVSYGNEILALKIQANNRVDALISAITALDSRQAEMLADTNFTSEDTAIIPIIKIEIAKKLAEKINLNAAFLATVKENLTKDIIKQ